MRELACCLPDAYPDTLRKFVRLKRSTRYEGQSTKGAAALG